MDVSINSGTAIVHKQSYELETIVASSIGFSFTLDLQAQQVEVRIFCRQGARLAILELDISPSEPIS